MKKAMNKLDQQYAVLLYALIELGGCAPRQETLHHIQNKAIGARTTKTTNRVLKDRTK